MTRLLAMFNPMRLMLALLAWPSSGMASIATSFQSGSGVSTTAMRDVILTIGAGVAVLFTAYVLTVLLEINSTADDNGKRLVWEYAIRIAILMALLVGTIFAL